MVLESKLSGGVRQTQINCQSIVLVRVCRVQIHSEGLHEAGTPMAIIAIGMLENTLVWAKQN